MSAAVSLPAVQDGLTAYLNQIKTYPVLTVEEEQDFALRYYEHGDQPSAHALVTSHLRLAAKIAMSYRRYGLPMSDLIAEGNLGLMKAVQKFEPSKGFRLSTYAMWWIKASINEYVLNSWSLVKIGTVSTQKRIFYNLRKMKAQLGAYEEGALTDEHAVAIAERLNVSATDVQAMNARLSARDGSLNSPIGDDGGMERVDYLVDPGPGQEEVMAANQERDRSRILVQQGLEVLNERERHIIVERRLSDDPVTLEALGEHYGLSRERVRQIEARAMEKLEARIKELVLGEKRGIRAAIEGFRNAFSGPASGTALVAA